MKIEIQKLQVVRHLVQISVILMLLLIPAIARYSNYVASREIDDHIENWQGSLQGETIAAIDSTLRALPNGEKPRLDTTVRDDEGVLHYTQQFRGGPWSVELFGLSMTDPLAALESIVARKHISKVIAISLIAPLILTFFFGRIFCSWICPVGLILEITDQFRKVIKFLEIRTRNIRFSPYTKFAVLAMGVLSSAIMSIPILGYIYPPAIFSREGHDLVFTLFDRAEVGQMGLSLTGLTWMSLILLGIIAFEVLISRRWWCRYMCPGGALYALIGFARPIRVKLRESKCTHCVKCVVACPMGLNPMNNEMGIDCDNCGACISSCHDDALGYAIQLKPSPKLVQKTINETISAK